MNTPGNTVVSTTEGRKHFPDYIQEAYGTKSIVGFDRYGRFLGALVPPEAILLLAGEDVGDEIDDFVKERIRRHAKDLLSQLNARQSRDDDRMSIDEIDAARKEKKERS